MHGRFRLAPWLLGGALVACSASPPLTAEQAAWPGPPPPSFDQKAASAGAAAPVDSAAAGAAASPATPSGPCLARSLLASLGQEHVLLGASMGDDTAASAPFDLRYLYLAGGMADGAGPCSRCDTGCTAGGATCANRLPDGSTAKGCPWWGCWQWDQEPPGGYARGFAERAQKSSELPFFTYYQLLHGSGRAEGTNEVGAANDVAFMRRYLGDFRFLLTQLAETVAFVHVEPDFWAYAQRFREDPHTIPAAVASASPECKGFENSVAGLGRCLVAMVRKHAPRAKVGLHASPWGTPVDVLLNSDPTLDVRAEAGRVGRFVRECGGGDADFVAVDASDRDAGYYQQQGRKTWWDATNVTLPNFRQAFAWASAVAEAVGRPIVWWQVPVGNMSLADRPQAFRDNRVDYLLKHLDEVARSHGAAVLFGAGDGNQTTPESDGGHLAGLVREAARRRVKACP